MTLCTLQTWLPHFLWQSLFFSLPLRALATGTEVDVIASQGRPQQQISVLQVRPKKAPVKQEFRPLTQEELLAEAAQTEIENTASVQVYFVPLRAWQGCCYCVS